MPDWKPLIRTRIAKLNLTAPREAEIIEEFSQHAEDRYRELRSAGASDADAVRGALAELGGTGSLVSELRTTERPQPRDHFLSGLFADVRFGLRMWRQNPGVTILALLALALGIGANTAIFSVVNGVLLQPLAYPDPARLIKIYESDAAFSYSSVAYLNYLDWKQTSQSFTGMGAYRNDAFNFTSGGAPEQITGVYATASLFPAIGVPAELGRTFLPEEDRQNAGCSVVITDGFWKRRFGASPTVLGKSLTLNGLNCSVIGVLPASVTLRRDAEVYLPIELYTSVELRNRDSHPGINVIARLKPGVTLANAQAEIAAIAGRLALEYPKTNAGHGARAVAMKEDLVGSIRPTLLLLLGAVAFVLIIACANVANLLLARSTARKREFAIRTALGADRARVVRQLLTESVLFSIGGALLGLILAAFGTRLVLAAAPSNLPRTDAIGIDPYVLLFTLSVSLVTGILFGLAPAVAGARTDPQDSLREFTRGSGGGRRRTEGIFVAVEVALAVVLLAGAGLMMRSVWQLWQVDPGFNTHNLLTAEVAVSPTAVGDGHRIRTAYDQMLDRLSATPGIDAAAITSLLPLGGSDSENSYWVGTGPQPPLEQMSTAMFSVVSPDYQSAMQFPLLRGRFFDRRDTLSTPPVVVIDDVMARHCFPGQDAVGKQLSLGGLGTISVIGVVRHIKMWGLDSDDTAKIRDQLYFPWGQVPDKYLPEAVAGVDLVVRARQEPLSLVPSIAAQVAGPTRDQPLYAVRTMEEVIARSLAERRFTMLVLLIFAATALALAAVGIYGVMSYAVTRQHQEIGIRTALGATRNEIIGMVLWRGLKLTGAGMAVGIAAAFALTRLMSGMLYGVRPADPVTLLSVLLLLGGVAVLACYIPARRATAVDPATVLRA
jgi:predicted permease